MKSLLRSPSPIDQPSLVADRPWDRYPTTAADSWGRAQAQHLLLRAGFGAGPDEVNQAVKAGLDATVEWLLAREADESFATEMAALERAIGPRRDANANVALWLHRMLKTPQPLVEKMTLFWHGHFATSGAKVTKASLLFDQNRLLRKHALETFGPLVHAISRDPAILIYLDSTDNRKTHPNENYARELMELFCLGIGNYSEQDIQEVARCFTGWEVRREKFRFNRYQHDGGHKSFLGSSGEFDGDQAIDVILRQEAAPRYLARKLLTFFVFDRDEIEDDLIDPLANQLRATDFDLRSALHMIFTSRLFYSTSAMGQKIRSPIELVIGTLRTFNASTNLFELGTVLNEMGQKPLFPPNVKGWDGGRAWINSATMLARQNFVYHVASSNDVKYHDGSLLNWLRLHSGSQPDEIVDFLLSTLVPMTVPDSIRQELLNLADAKSSDPDVAAQRVVAAVGALPEFQLT